MKAQYKKELAKHIDLSKLGERKKRMFADLYPYGKNQVLKISYDLEKNEQKFLELLKWARNKKNIVKINKFGQLKDGTIWYVMDKLLPIKKSNIRKIFDSYGIEYNCCVLNGEKCECGEKYHSLKIKKFFSYINKYKYFYIDMHSGNVMKEKNGNYKLIDLEGFRLEI